MLWTNGLMDWLFRRIAPKMKENERPARSLRYILIALPVAVLAAVLVSAAAMPMLLRNACLYSDDKPVQFCDLNLLDTAWLGVNRAGLPAGIICAVGLFLLGLVVTALPNRSVNAPWWLWINGLIGASASLFLCIAFVTVASMIDNF